MRFPIELQSLLCTYTPLFDPRFVKNPGFVCVYLKKFLVANACGSYTQPPKPLIPNWLTLNRVFQDGVRDSQISAQILQLVLVKSNRYIIENIPN